MQYLHYSIIMTLREIDLQTDLLAYKSKICFQSVRLCVTEMLIVTKFRFPNKMIYHFLINNLEIEDINISCLIAI